MPNPHGIRAPARFCQALTGRQCPARIDISPFQPLPTQPVCQGWLFVQHFEIHILEINILAQVLEQSCIEQNLELVGSRNAAVLVSLLLSPKSNVRVVIFSERICSGSCVSERSVRTEFRRPSCTFPDRIGDPGNVHPGRIRPTAPGTKTCRYPGAAHQVPFHSLVGTSLLHRFGSGSDPPLLPRKWMRRISRLRHRHPFSAWADVPGVKG